MPGRVLVPTELTIARYELFRADKESPKCDLPLPGEIFSTSLSGTHPATRCSKERGLPASVAIEHLLSPEWCGIRVLSSFSACPGALILRFALRTLSHDAVRVGNARRFRPTLIDREEMAALCAAPPLIRLAGLHRVLGQHVHPPWVVGGSYSRRSPHRALAPTTFPRWAAHDRALLHGKSETAPKENLSAYAGLSQPQLARILRSRAAWASPLLRPALPSSPHFEQRSRGARARTHEISLSER